MDLVSWEIYDSVDTSVKKDVIFGGIVFSSLYFINSLVKKFIDYGHKAEMVI